MGVSKVTAFIETQFPIARLSAEAYKERKAGASQTLTGLGKWWGRKPLILVRASILGMLMPASDDPKKDREIFLKILTMDEDGAWQRSNGKLKDKNQFDSLIYADRIKNCSRPENISGPTVNSWAEINTHLGTSSSTLHDLVEQLGQKAFGHIPKVGDSFCGGGSIPFEASRIGCEAYGSDLNPAAVLLSWSSIYLLGASKKTQSKIQEEQEEVFKLVKNQLKRWGIDENEHGEQAEYYLYCVEVKPEGSEYYIPVAPSWVVSEKYNIITTWERVSGSDRLQAKVTPVSNAEFALYKAKKGATFADSRVIDPFDTSRSWSVESLRGSDGLRLWDKSDVTPRSSDVFQERLYCIRWINDQGVRRYSAPTGEDIKCEEKILILVSKHLGDWQKQGFIASKKIESGYNTDQPIRERGWTHWHHLFTPRQLLMHGLFMELAMNRDDASKEFKAACLLGISASSDWSSKLCRWTPQMARSGGIGASVQTFYNQALNTLFTWANRPFEGFKNVVKMADSKIQPITNSPLIAPSDARDINEICDLWITDPPYADAVNYHELGDYFLSWYDKQLASVFPEWYSDSRSNLAVCGDGDDFRRSMVEVYKNLSEHMPDNGLQMVMFTHQNPAVWADLGMILWAAGLKVTAAWTISTETEAAGIKKGNYVQGTVCLILRKRLSSEPGFLDEVYPLVEDEVKRQIGSMQALDEGTEPNFNDADYQLAAYAAALKVLTQYGNLDGRDVEYEVFAIRSKNKKSDFQTVIERALQIACDTLVPNGLDDPWRDLSLVERYYLRALDIESRGERRKGMYEELARGFGVTDIKPLLKSDKANGARMYTPSGLANALLAPVDGTETDDTEALPARKGRAGSNIPHIFSSSTLRHLMFAIKETAASDNSPEPGRQYLRDTFGQMYWGGREGFIFLLEWLSAMGNTEGMEEWIPDSEAARILSGRLRNDHA
jgi:putative DNA methylase